jgi:glycerol-3-phosphate cytidylyltransferase-like family protein
VFDLTCNGVLIDDDAGLVCGLWPIVSFNERRKHQEERSTQVDARLGALSDRSTAVLKSVKTQIVRHDDDWRAGAAAARSSIK